MSERIFPNGRWITENEIRMEYGKPDTKKRFKLLGGTRMSDQTPERRDLAGNGGLFARVRRRIGTLWRLGWETLERLGGVRCARAKLSKDGGLLSFGAGIARVLVGGRS